MIALISASIALLDRELNHSRKCLDVPIRKKFDSQNISRKKIQYAMSQSDERKNYIGTTPCFYATLEACSLISGFKYIAATQCHE